MPSLGPHARDALAALPAWSVESTKAHLSEVIRRARRDGPQRVTSRGRDAVVILSAEEYERLAPPSARGSLVDFLRGSGLADVEVERPEDRGREIDL